MPRPAVVAMTVRLSSIFDVPDFRASQRSRPFPDVDFVDQGEARCFAVLCAAVAGNGGQGHVVSLEDDLLGRVVGVIDARRRDQTVIHPHNVRGLTKADPGLFPVAGREDHLTGRNPFRADGVEKRQCGGERGLAVAAWDQEEDVLDDPAAVRVARPVDAPHNPFLPVVKLKGAFRGGRVRVPEKPQEPHGTLAVTERVGDGAAVEDPRWVSAGGDGVHLCT